MNTTLQIRPSVWNHAIAYANSRGEQLTTIVERLLMSLEIPQVDKNTSEYYISPRLKGFVTGKEYGKEGGDNYKEELLDALSEKYL